MKIISHRGFWKQPDEKNKLIAFERSFHSGFGTETDIRDFNGDLVVSHDVPRREDECMRLVDFLACYKRFNGELLLALNIKSDGLQSLLMSYLHQFDVINYFVFDMSVPDAIEYKKAGVRFYSRQSEYEPDPIFYDDCVGIWLDAFNNIWYDSALLKKHIQSNKLVAIVSPDLHKREHLPFWKYLKQQNLDSYEQIILCTDLPEEAKSYFRI